MEIRFNHFSGLAACHRCLKVMTSESLFNKSFNMCGHLTVGPITVSKTSIFRPAVSKELVCSSVELCLYLEQQWLIMKEFLSVAFTIFFHLIIDSFLSTE